MGTAGCGAELSRQNMVETDHRTATKECTPQIDRLRHSLVTPHSHTHRSCNPQLQHLASPSVTIHLPALVSSLLVSVLPREMPRPIVPTDTPDPWMIKYNSSYILTFTSGNRIELWQSPFMADFSDSRTIKRVIWLPPDQYTADVSGVRKTAAS
jgi:hypothetical protein